MALHPNTFVGQDRLQPGARGDIFNADLPGYRDGADRINRTQNKLNTNAHDVPNIKYMLDSRLPVLFKYGFAFGYNQIVMPKGRIVAVDPNMDLVDFDMKKAHNTLTLATGGVNVKLGADKKEWEKTTDTMTVDPKTGKAVVGGQVRNDYRFANKPIGVISRNEYTRDDDAFNGIMPGAVLTDAMIEMPWFLSDTDAKSKEKAEGNPWGSAHGKFFPGALVKSDENGRFIISPLSIDTELEKLTVAQYEKERQQVVGQIYATNKDLIPEGAAKYAQWAISDIMNFEGFNPSLYKQNGRRGEDAISNSPYNSEGKYPGYPYDQNYMDSDLHMLSSYRGTYNQRMQHEHRYDHGIPGLTDGYNAVSTPIEDKGVGHFGCAAIDSDKNGTLDAIDASVPYVDMYFRTRVENVEAGSLQVQVGSTAYAPATVGAVLVATAPAKVGGATTTGTFLRVKYADELQGIIVLEVFDRTAADAFFTTVGVETKIVVSLKYNKRGMAGVPTFMDWDGCIGSVKILLQK